jgi:hypothetical protein
MVMWDILSAVELNKLFFILFGAVPYSLSVSVGEVKPSGRVVVPGQSVEVFIIY